MLIQAEGWTRADLKGVERRTMDAKPGRTRVSKAPLFRMKTVICVKDAVEPGSCGTSMAFVRPKQVRGERSRGEKGNGKEARVYKIG